MSRLAALQRAPGVGSLAGWLARLDPGRPDRLAILTYHRVAEPDGETHPGLISASPAAFAEQMAALATDYRVVSLATVLERLAGGAPIPARAVLVTFDDAYADFAEHAWPVLRRLGLPAALFVPTAYPDDRPAGFWWDRLYRAASRVDGDRWATPVGVLPLRTQHDRAAAFRAVRDHLKSLPHDEAMAAVDRLVDAAGDPGPTRPTVLGWDALRLLADEGVELAPHTRTHPLLTRLSRADVAREIAGSVDDLVTRVGPVPPAFAYPSGAVSDTVVEVVREQGIRLALTTVRGVNDLRRSDPLRLRRINVGAGSGLAAIRAQMLTGSGPLLGVLERRAASRRDSGHAMPSHRGMDDPRPRPEAAARPRR